MSKYIYNVRLSNGCKLFISPPLMAAVRNAAEMIIASRYYPTYDECLSDLSSLMSKLCELMNKADDKRYVVLSKFKDRDEDAVQFSDLQMARLYVVEAEPLKTKAEMNFTISAHVSLSKSS